MSKNDDQSNPIALVESFFKALEKDDVEKMVKLATVQKLENIKNVMWREVWRKYQVVDIIKVSKHASQEKMFDEVTEVEVKYNLTESVLQELAKHYKTDGAFTDTIHVVRIGTKWYWNEN